MRRIFAVLIAAILLFNTVVFADEAVDIGGNNILAAFSVNPQFDGDLVVIKLSELSRASDLNFSYNTETGFLYAEDGRHRILIRELDENIEIDESAIKIGSDNGMQIAFPYSFKVFTYICRQKTEADPDRTILAPQDYFGGKDNVSAMAEATLEFNSGKVQLVLQDFGTSSQIIDSENIGGFLDDDLLLVNKNNTLRRDYTPSGLIYSKPVRGRSTVNLRLDSEAMLHLNYMLDSAYNQGISGLVITSAFRTFDKQTSLFNNKTTLLSRKMSRKTAMEEASKVVAVPGSSEHQTGLAADICSDGVGLIGNFGSTVQGKWMEENSWKFGFIVRYPKEKTELTGIIYEPWHVRYVGSVHSGIMKANNMCFEEYMEYLKKNKLISFSDSSGSNYAVQYIYKPDFDTAGMSLSLPGTSTWNISNCTRDSYILTIKL